MMLSLTASWLMLSPFISSDAVATLVLCAVWDDEQITVAFRMMLAAIALAEYYYARYVP